MYIVISLKFTSIIANQCLSLQATYVCEHEVADCDSGVKELATDLTSLKMNTVGILTLPKQNYLFNGVGHLVAAIFINSTSYLNKININGVKKM